MDPAGRVNQWVGQIDYPMYRMARGAEMLGVHLVPPTATHLAELFGSQTGDGVDKFARCAWHAGPEGVPLLDECPNWLAGRVLERLPVGDHHAIVLEPVAAGASEDPAQFGFHRAKRFEPGHEA